MSEIALAARPATARSFGQWLAGHWFAVFLIGYGSWVWLPWLAPALMHAGQAGAGHALYFIYSLFCHQLPERSFFLFGSRPMFSLREIQGAWQNTNNTFVLRSFVGNEAMGWKVAWSDRMVSFYTSIWMFSVVWLLFRRKIKPLSWWVFVLLLLPLVLDGATHTVSDLAGIGQGFRDSNQWLAGLTNHALAASFYAGDALGSFNSWMRLLTGLVAGLGIVWFSFPFLEDSFAED
jgi:uncharacterized membrane protein